MSFPELFDTESQYFAFSKFCIYKLDSHGFCSFELVLWKIKPKNSVIRETIHKCDLSKVKEGTGDATRPGESSGI